MKPTGELPLEDFPVLVRFRDPNDPTSVELVDPSNLAASFGPGVMLRRAFVEITDDPITKGIETRVPCWHQVRCRPLYFCHEIQARDSDGCQSPPCRTSSL